MRNRIQIALLTFLWIAGAGLLPACVQKGNRGPRARVSTPGSPDSPGRLQGDSPIEARGTSDSGGGTGVDGKVFESYIVDPIKLPAYAKYMAPLLKNIIDDDPEEKESFDRAFALKTWYIAPVDLDDVNKDVLGISFMKSQTQQLARQTPKEVWIDKRIFDSMKPEDQSDLILHEFVMALYFVKFMKMSEICKFTSSVEKAEQDSCASNGKFFDLTMPAEKLHSLTDQDNENIRFVTGWMKQKLQKPIPKRDFVKVLFDRGFDKRLFNPGNYETASEATRNLTVTAGELYQAVRGAELSGNLPDVCYRAGSDASPKPCQVRFEKSQIDYFGNKVPGFEFELSVDSQKIRFNTVSDKTFDLVSSQNNDDGIVYTYFFGSWSNRMRMGDRAYSGFMVFTKSEAAGLILETVSVRPATVVSIDKNRDPVCKFRAPKVKIFTDDSILIKSEGVLPTLVDRLYATMPDLSWIYCSPDSVVD